MSPAEHYAAAEQLLDMASADELGTDEERYRLAAAQVHATLATVPAMVVQQQRLDELPVTPDKL